MQLTSADDYRLQYRKLIFAKQWQTLHVKLSEQYASLLEDTV